MLNSLRTRILITLAVLSLALVLTTVWMTRLAFQEGFLSYLNEQMSDRMESIASIAAAHYERNGGWQRIRQEPSLWAGMFDDRDRDFIAQRQGPPGGQPPRPEANQVQRNALEIELLLTDAEHRLLAGRRRSDFDALDETVLRVAVVSGGETVGYVVSPRLPRIEAQLDRSFVSGQTQIAVRIGLITLIVALPLALIIAAWLLSPIKKLNTGLRSLAEGDYGQQLQVTRKDELGSLAASLNHLSLVLEANRHNQQRWIADISHELRTPVAILEGEIDALVDGIREPGAAELASLADEVRRLGALINDLHTLAKADSGDLSYRMQPLSVAALLTDATSHFQQRAENVGLRLTTKASQSDLLVKGDKDRLLQLLSNLLENSCRYSDPGGEIAVSCAHLADRNIVAIVVSDTGPGVSDEQMQRLFDRLYRVESSRNSATGGSGLGLAICKQIAEAHQGELKASHSPLGGLCMTLLLPEIVGHEGAENDKIHTDS